LEICFQNTLYKKLFGDTLAHMLEVGIVQDTAILRWANEQAENTEGEDKIFYEQALHLINKIKKNGHMNNEIDIEEMVFDSNESLSIEEVPFNEDEEVNDEEKPKSISSFGDKYKFFQ